MLFLPHEREAILNGDETNMKIINIIYADPPWRYEGNTAPPNDAIENHYPTMTLDDICKLNVPAGTDAVLFLWVTSPKLYESMRVIDAWGFTYRTCMVWDKGSIGPGYYARQQHELLLISIKGKPGTPLPEARPASIFKAKRKRHSEKPRGVYTMIEHMYPNGNYIELFARYKREGWHCWGNEVPTTTQRILRIEEMPDGTIKEAKP
jgi:N6-adenosine-specific RNA methylase IME4